MAWAVVIRKAALNDIQSVINWYNAESPEQITRFAIDFDATIEKIAKYPLVPAPFYHKIRRLKLHSFPYQIWYITDTDPQIVQVIAVVHRRQSTQQFLDIDR